MKSVLGEGLPSGQEEGEGQDRGCKGGEAHSLSEMGRQPRPDIDP